MSSSRCSDVRTTISATPDRAASMVDTSKSLSASCTCSSVTCGCRHILARDSLTRVMASSWRTVIGTAGAPPFLARSLISCRYRTYWSSRSLALFGCNLGLHMARQYSMKRFKNFCSRSCSGFFSPPLATNAISSPPPACMPSTCSAICRSRSYRRSSRTMKIRSNRDKMVVCKSMFSCAVFRSSYLPEGGLAAASTAARELSTVVMPALAILIVCCSIASWIATRSSSRILSNSSMHTHPPSASTMAPPSR
mmetsp:Transcript_21945/g.54284  ORF Transcript_21945/g.54284 Transcript_21945/m.54284 type:complete len:252 (-) Transcript_21945:430-1185(-)